MTVRWVALTGTPGTGKTSVARELRRLGFEVVDGKRFATQNRCIVGVDRARRSGIVDLERVGRALERAYGPTTQLRVLECHWSHEVPGMDAALVLRYRPRDLAVRLFRRGWSRAKMRENLEAEAIDLITQEAAAGLGPRNVGEIDMTRRSARSAARHIARILEASRRRLTNVEIGIVSWADELLRWY